MKSFRQFLDEMGDSSHEFKEVKPKKEPYADSSHRYEFKDSAGNTKHVDIHHHSYYDKPHASVTFHDASREKAGWDKYDATGELGRHAVRVFSTVKHILKHHAKKHPDLHAFDFDSSHDEPSRVKLYTRLTRSLGGQTNAHDHEGIAHHSVEASKLR